MVSASTDPRNRPGRRGRPGRYRTTPEQAHRAGASTNSALTSILIKANPVSAGLTLADNVLVKQQPWSDQATYLISPIVGAVALTALAVALSRRLELGGSR